jgi:hypothetical protein
MDLTPGEKAVLGQIRVLYSAESRRDQQVKALMMQWPPVHCEAYKKAFGALLAKALIQDLDTQIFRITDTGLKAIGVSAVPQPRVQARPVAQPQPAPQPSPRRVAKPSGNPLSRFMSGLLGRTKSAGR